MALLDSAILALCIHSKYPAACKASLEAGAKQSGFYQVSNNAEHIINYDAQRDATQNFGENTVLIIGGAGLIAKVVRDRSIDFNLPNFGLCDSLSNHIGLNSYGVRMGWNF